LFLKIWSPEFCIASALWQPSMSCLERLLSSDQQWLVLVAGTGYVPMSQIARLGSDEDTADEVPREFDP
jgi:hypothetical protein